MSLLHSGHLFNLGEQVEQTEVWPHGTNAYLSPAVLKHTTHSFAYVFVLPIKHLIWQVYRKAKNRIYRCAKMKFKKQCRFIFEIPTALKETQNHKFKFSFFAQVWDSIWIQSNWIPDSPMSITPVDIECSQTFNLNGRMFHWDGENLYDFKSTTLFPPTLRICRIDEELIWQDSKLTVSGQVFRLRLQPKSQIYVERPRMFKFSEEMAYWQKPSMNLNQI